MDEQQPEPGDGRRDIPWGTQWDLTRAADPAIIPDGRVNLGFQDGRAGGRGPVNRYFGTCTQQDDGRLALGPFGMTMMAGSEAAMAAEQAYLQLLDRVAGVRRSGTELVLVDTDGVELLAYQPSAEPR